MTLAEVDALVAAVFDSPSGKALLAFMDATHMALSGAIIHQHLIRAREHRALPSSLKPDP